MTNKRTNHYCSGKNFRKGKSAVSEIIGNLLILAITVTLFSSVLLFVINMPAPQDQLSAISVPRRESPGRIYT